MHALSWQKIEGHAAPLDASLQDDFGHGLMKGR